MQSGILQIITDQSKLYRCPITLTLCHCIKIMRDKKRKTRSKLTAASPSNFKMFYGVVPLLCGFSYFVGQTNSRSGWVAEIPPPPRAHEPGWSWKHGEVEPARSYKYLCSPRTSFKRPAYGSQRASREAPENNISGPL